MLEPSAELSKHRCSARHLLLQLPWWSTTADPVLGREPTHGTDGFMDYPRPVVCFTTLVRKS